LSDQGVLEGLVSIQAALESSSREVHKILIREDKRDRATARVQRLARQKDVPVERVEETVIDAQASGRTHGGIIAHVGPRRFVDLEGLLLSSSRPLVVMLDGIEDPYNFGAAVRALYAAGADGLVVRPRNWMSAAGVVARSSAGATEWMPTAIAETVPDAADMARTHGLTIACAAKGRATSIYEADLARPLFCVIGGEKRGITRSFAEQADIRLSIPYGRRFPRSLGTASAVAVLAFEAMRQRTEARSGRGPA
jgi:23S rRNA (guanosine2251-2'-O)-methyltransferase